mmetsp:Transcript_25499/g.73372  ORF Transcript_25499/g.73372 Transcript_25499/m.73372 type:complete len:216 (-) Transcript_25499:380-1027(-)
MSITPPHNPSSLSRSSSCFPGRWAEAHVCGQRKLCTGVSRNNSSMPCRNKTESASSHSKRRYSVNRQICNFQNAICQDLVSRGAARGGAATSCTGRTRTPSESKNEERLVPSARRLELLRRTMGWRLTLRMDCTKVKLRHKYTSDPPGSSYAIVTKATSPAPATPRRRCRSSTALSKANVEPDEAAGGAASLHAGAAQWRNMRWARTQATAVAEP